jgi:hypothetical protein
MVVFNKSEDSLRLTNSRGTQSTTPNPKRVKYEVTERQLLAGRYEKVLICSESSDAKAMDGSLSAPSMRCHLTPLPMHEALG